MKIHKVLFLMIFITFVCGYGATQSFYDHNNFLLASTGSLYVGLYGYDNPALLTYLHAFDLAFIWSDQIGA